MTFTVLTNGGLDATQASYTTASVTVVAGRMYLLSVYNRSSNVSSLSGPSGVSWNLVDQFSDDVNQHVALYVATPAADATGAVTINFGVDQSRCAWGIVEVDGASGIVQSAASQQLNVTSATFSLSGGLESPNNAVYCVVVHGNNDTATPESGWTRLFHDTTGASWDRINSTAQYNTGGDTSYTEDWGFNSGCAVICELSAVTPPFVKRMSYSNMPIGKLA